MPKKDTFAKTVVEAFRNAKIMGVRAGAEHRYTGVWVAVVDDRVFARSWYDKPTGWFRAFKKEPNGTVQLGEREIAVRGKPVRSARIRDAVTAAFAEKYPTKGSRQWVEGFAEPERVINTLEFIPRRGSSPKIRSSKRKQEDNVKSSVSQTLTYRRTRGG